MQCIRAIGVAAHAARSSRYALTPISGSVPAGLCAAGSSVASVVAATWPPKCTALQVRHAYALAKNRAPDLATLIPQSVSRSRVPVFAHNGPFIVSGSYEEALQSYPTELSKYSQPHVSKSLRTPVRRTDGRFITFKPITPGLRHRRDIDMDALGVHQGEPVPELTYYMPRTGGRNNKGVITVRGRGGGPRRILRLVDFMRTDTGPQRVVRLEYDQFRSSFVALVRHEITGVMSYITAPRDLKVGNIVASYRNGVTQKELTPLPGEQSILGQPGNCFQLKYITHGTMVHNISLQPSGPGIICRSAGSKAILLQCAIPGRVQLKLQSGEIRTVDERCVATIGQVSNPDWKHIILGKAGRNRARGRRPKVRGTAMNACDHPHGGGEGKTRGKHPKSPWGVPCKGYRTRDKRKPKWWVVKDRRAK